MSDLTSLIQRIHSYAAANNKSPTTLSRILFGNGERLKEIEGGSSIRMDTFERAKAKLDEMESASDLVISSAQSSTEAA